MWLRAVGSSWTEGFLCVRGMLILNAECLLEWFRGSCCLREGLIARNRRVSPWKALPPKTFFLLPCCHREPPLPCLM